MSLMRVKFAKRILSHCHKKPKSGERFPSCPVIIWEKPHRMESSNRKGERGQQTVCSEKRRMRKLRRKAKRMWAMKALPWLLVVLLAILSGCATPENVDRNVQIDYFNGLHQMQNRMDSLLYNIQLMQKETNEKLSNLKLENKTVYLSVPDSIGRQYPTSVSQTTVNKEEKEHKTTDMRTEATLKQLITEIDELRQQFNAATLKKEKVEEVSWWQLHKVDVYAILLVVLLLVYLIYKVRKKSLSL